MSKLNEILRTNSQRIWQELQNPVTVLNCDIPKSLIRLKEILNKQELNTWENMQYRKAAPAYLEKLNILSKLNRLG